MRIAVSALGTDLDARMDPRFGRCAYFIVVNMDDMSFQAYDNEHIALGGGAGIQAARFVASKGVNAVITGNCGPNAMRTLNAAGVQVVVGQSGSVKNALEAYKEGKLSGTSKPNVSDHFGMGDDFEAAASRLRSGTDGGRGMGCGQGRGMGRGCAQGFPTGSAPATAENASEQELKSLRDQAKELRRQIETMETRIRELEGR